MTSDNQQELERELIRDEGLRLKPYVDTVGKLTIGVGRNLTDRGITASEAMILFRNDISSVEHELVYAFGWFPRLDSTRQRVVLNMVFNLGLDRFAEFKLAIAAIERGDYAGASDEMINSRWALQVGARAQRLADMMRG